MSKDKQCCGTCKHWEHYDRDLGDCEWEPTGIVPDSFVRSENERMWRDEGVMCECWKEKEKDEHEVWVGTDEWRSQLETT